MSYVTYTVTSTVDDESTGFALLLSILTQDGVESRKCKIYMDRMLFHNIKCSLKYNASIVGNLDYIDDCN